MEMRLFVWTRLEHVSHNTHSGGGLVIVAEDRDQAERIVKNYNATVTVDDDIDYPVEPERDAIILDWDRLTFESVAEADKPQIFVFPNAGCC